MRIKFFLVVFLMSFIFSNQYYKDSWAVIIGINKYKNFQPLHYAVDDANDVKNLLLNKFYF